MLNKGFKSLARIATVFSATFLCLILFFKSQEKGQLTIGLFMALLLGIVLITEGFPSFLDKVSARFFAVSVSLFSGCLYVLNTQLFNDLDPYLKNTVTVFMVLIAISTGIGLSYPFRKAKRVLDK